MQEAQSQAVAALRKFGARVSQDADGNVTAVDLAQTAITDADLALLAPCPGIVELNLRGALVTDAGLEAIAAHSQVEFLGLTGTMVTDAGLVHLQKLPRLRFLTLGHTSVTDAGLKALAGCSQLEGLNVKATTVTAAGLVQLQTELPSCRIVSDVTSNTSIESQDLPVPMAEDVSADSSKPPLPPLDGPIGLPESLADPFAPAPTEDRPRDLLDIPVAPPAELQELPPPPPSADAAPRKLRRSGAAPGPVRRLERVLSDSLDDPSVLRAIAQSYAARNEWDAAASVLRKAVDLTPQDLQLQFELGVAEARSGDFVASLMHLQQCGSLAVAHYNLGVLLHEAGLEEASILAFRSALRYDPQLVAARQWLNQLSPPQPLPAAVKIGQRPGKIGGRGVTPVEAQSPTDADSNGTGIEIHPADGDRTIARPQRPLAAR